MWTKFLTVLEAKSDSYSSAEFYKVSFIASSSISKGRFEKQLFLQHQASGFAPVSVLSAYLLIYLTRTEVLVCNKYCV